MPLQVLGLAITSIVPKEAKANSPAFNYLINEIGKATDTVRLAANKAFNDVLLAIVGAKLIELILDKKVLSKSTVLAPELKNLVDGVRDNRRTALTKAEILMILDSKETPDNTGHQTLFKALVARAVKEQKTTLRDFERASWLSSRNKIFFEMIFFIRRDIKKREEAKEERPSLFKFKKYPGCYGYVTGDKIMVCETDQLIPEHNPKARAPLVKMFQECAVRAPASERLPDPAPIPAAGSAPRTDYSALITPFLPDEIHEDGVEMLIHSKSIGRSQVANSFTPSR